MPSFSVTSLIASRHGAGRLVQEGQRVENRDDFVAQDVIGDRLRAAPSSLACGENATWASMPDNSRSCQRWTPSRRSLSTQSFFQVVLERIENGWTAASVPRRMIALLDCTNEAAPGEVGGAADDRLNDRAVDHDGLVVLQVAHVLPLHLVASRRGDQTALRLWSRPSVGLPWSLLSSMMTCSRFLSFSSRETTVGIVEVVGDHADQVAACRRWPRRALQGSRCALRSPSSSSASSALGWVGTKVESVVSLVRKQGVETVGVSNVAIDERLGRARNRA